MSSYDYDLFVIGAGSGGVRTARMAAAEGIKVAVAEKSKPGGTCVNLGCVPKKLYVHAAEYGAGFLQSPGFGWQSQAPLFDWPTLRDNKSETITRLNGMYTEILGKAGVEMIDGHARVTGPNEVDVAGKRYSAERILLATGGRPSLPEIPGSEYLLSSDQIFDLPELPKRMLIVGGGYIATEFTGIFHGLGVNVTQIYRRELFLRGFDTDIREFVAKQMRESGIDLRFNCDLKQVVKNADGSLNVTLKDGSNLQTDLILAATGRVPNTENLGLDEVGVKLGENGRVLVDDFYQTNIPSIYALGDLIDRMQLTPVALAEGMTLVRHLYKGGAEKLDYSLVPTAVFSKPNIGTVGLTEEEAIEQYPQIDVYSANFRSLKHALSGSSERVLMKLLVDPATDKVVGAHMAGEMAGETIQGIAVALKAGATKTNFDKTIGIHPTSAEEFVTMRTKTRTVSK
ncbi:NADPH-glutathione reductase [Malonomonas rubra DSM 5091]|uniref:NADPH-glutathione reductase n=1 Tax=Malonomonas rubra DSM 5091 TaxID=1122189 RepID=A0A1M6DHJ2_MALRU|nr:glutathione-disulfide reductase [Malonomonas rubra]SHI72478.1 NADPH-glutathione reductase [Malonomonas rubra DSM 5091]